MIKLRIIVTVIVSVSVRITVSVIVMFGFTVMVRFRYSVIDIFKGRVMLKDCVKVRFIVNIRVIFRVSLGFWLDSLLGLCLVFGL